jgi:succinate dehydrogenase hydrophobic anchor subunit
MRKLRDNSLTLVLLALAVIFMAAQAIVGFREYNEDRQDHHRPAVTFSTYMTTGHIWESYTENWESEFLQMAALVVLSAFLFQKGSPESKDPDKEEEVDREPNPARKGAPAILKNRLGKAVYSRSLSLALFSLFAASFFLHASSGAKEYSEDQIEHGGQAVGMLAYMGTSRFWFESLQNWQSEFLSVGILIFLSIYLREKGSPESKPVDAPHAMTGEA